MEYPVAQRHPDPLGGQVVEPGSVIGTSTIIYIYIADQDMDIDMDYLCLYIY